MYQVSFVDSHVYGERRDVPQQDGDQLLRNLSSLLNKYYPNGVFNVDETALNYRCLLERTLETNHNAASGRQLSKDRVTVHLGDNMTGKMLLPQVIGRYKSPRCLSGIESTASMFLQTCRVV